MRLKNQRLCLSLTLFSLCSAEATVASPPHNGQTPESRSMTIAVDDLNVTTAAGYTEALARISAVARQLCNRLHNNARVDDRESAAECMRTAIAAASSQLRSTPIHPAR